MSEPATDVVEDLLGVTQTVRGEDPVCLACLGRLVAERSFGLTNEERGRALRITLALAADEPYEPPDAADCWVCEGELTRLDWWAEQVVEALSGIEFDTYQIGCRVPPLLEENERLLRELVDLDPDAGEPLKGELNREVGKRVGQALGVEVDFERPDVLALLHLERGDVEVSINPAFVYGRYRKLERDIPQTEWPCTDCGASGKQLGPDGEEPCEGCDGTGYRYDRSVEQLTTPPVVDAMGGSEGVFHGAGREDVDARMLGSGRPFVIEVKQPERRTPALDRLTAAINEYAEGVVEVDDLALATYEMVERVKELSASKTYRMEIDLAAPVEAESFEMAIDRLDGATIEQRTPTRVRHRRSDLVRTRQVFSCSGTLLSPDRAEVEVRGEGGLYVKELVSGDDGGTTPSLAGELGVGATVTALDVVDVEGEDERFAKARYLIDSPAVAGTGNE